VNPKAETVEELQGRRKVLHLGMLKLAREDLVLLLQAGIDTHTGPPPPPPAPPRPATLDVMVQSLAAGTRRGARGGRAGAPARQSERGAQPIALMVCCT
jgi:hypothetical protein